MTLYQYFIGDTITNNFGILQKQMRIAFGASAFLSLDEYNERLYINISLNRYFDTVKVTFNYKEDAPGIEKHYDSNLEYVIVSQSNENCYLALISNFVT